MTGMSYMSGSKAARNQESLGFTSIGGPKKAGTFSGSVAWPQGNMGSHVFWRAPQSQPSILFSLRNTTRNPVQGTRYKAYARRGIMG